MSVVLEFLIPFFKPKLIGSALLLSVFLYFLARENYLLFHSTVECFSIVVALLIYVLATRTYKYSSSSFLLFLGNAYFFIAIIDFLHLLTYKGMGVFPFFGPDTPTQLWIAGRYVEALSLFLAFFFIKRKFSYTAVFWSYVSVIIILLLSIMWIKIFPVCFIEDKGLTIFKIISEYIISIILLGSIWQLYLRRSQIHDFLYKTIFISLIVTILSEMSFTLYSDVYGLMNMLGHILKVISYLFIYWGIVYRGLDSPYDTLFKELSESEKKLRIAHQQLLDIIDFLPDATFVIDRNRKVIAWNRAIEEMTGVNKKQILGKDNFSYSALFYGTQRPILIDHVLTLDEKGLELEYENIERKGVTIYAEFRIPFMQGKKDIYLWGKASPLLDSDGNIVGAIESIRDITKHKQAEEKLRHLSDLDGLTGIPNRRSFEEYLERKWNCAVRNKKPLSLIICDIDYFKAYNDSYGHLLGDECIRKAAEALRKKLKRSEDLAARYGGEEFAVILPETDLDGAAVVAEILRAAVEALSIEHRNSKISDILTISLGVASIVPNMETSASALVALADKALYQAKEEGRNRLKCMKCTK